MMRKLFSTLVLGLVLLFSASAAGQPYGLMYYHVQIVDIGGDTVTSSIDVDVQTSGSSATIYSDPNKTSLTNPITAQTDGYVEWWGAETSYDVVVELTGGTNSTKKSSFTPVMHRVYFSPDTFVMTGAISSTSTLTVTGDVSFDSGVTWLFDSSDNDFVSLDSAATEWGTGKDVSITFDGADWLFDAITADEGLKFGDTTTGFDLTYYFETAGTIALDYDADSMLLTDAVDLIFGTNSDWILQSDTATEFDFIPLTTDETSIINIGATTAGADLRVWGTDGTDYIQWDASADYLHMVGDLVLYTLAEAAVNQFKVDATGVGAGHVIVLETTDGGIQLNADGAENGDIAIDAADDMTLTAAGNLTLAVTGTYSHGGAQVTNTLVPVEAVTAQTNALAATESGTVYQIVYTGTHTTTLPDAAAGLIFTFVDASATAGDDVAIDCQAGDNIDGDTNGDAIESVTDAVGQTVTLVAIDGMDWHVINVSGTWGQQ